MVRAIVAYALLVVMSECDQRKGASDLFLPGRSLGKNKNEKLEEASGLVASERNKGYLWTHNDGGKPQLFLLDTAAVTQRVFTLHGVRNRDWEDIAMGPGPDPNANYLYIGDVGDNFARYPYKYIYRIKEPALDDTPEITEFDSIRVTLSDAPRDIEALLVDPLNGSMYMVSKRDNPAGLYELPKPEPGPIRQAKRILDLPLRYIVAGDISRDGKEVILKSYDEIFYWRRTDQEPLPELLKREPIRLPYEREPQGEAIAWALDGSGYYTLGENARGERAKLIFYQRRK